MSELAQLIEGMALHRPRLLVATIHRRIGGVAKKQNWPIPSYGSVYAIVRGLDPGMVTLALEGHAAWRDRFDLIYHHRAERPNAIWQADHTMLDILVLDANGNFARPWLTTVIDDHSRAVAGYTVFIGAPSALNTSLALRQAIWRKQEPGWRKGMIVVSSVIGVSLLWRFWQASTPATIRRLLKFHNPDSRIAPDVPVDPSALAQNIIFSFLHIDPTMSLNAAVALLMVCQAQTRKEPIQTSDLSQALMLSPSTTTRLMAYLGEGKEDEGFNGLGFVDLQIDKKDRRLPIA